MTMLDTAIMVDVDLVIEEVKKNELRRKYLELKISVERTKQEFETAERRLKEFEEKPPVINLDDVRLEEIRSKMKEKSGLMFTGSLSAGNYYG